MLKSPKYQDWEFPGGQVEEGETLTQAVEREVVEETGIVVKPERLVGIYSNTRKPPILMLDFICEFVSGELLTSAESLEVAWVDRHEALNRVKRPPIYKRLKKMLEFTGSVTYRAYRVDPSRIDLEYQELEESTI